MTPQLLESIKEFVKSKNIGLIVVDTLSCLWDIKDGNAAVEVSRAMETILNLARGTGCAILLVHHLRKTPGEGGDDILGSTALFASVDVAISLKDRKENPNHRILEAQSRYPLTPQELVIALEDGEYRALGENYLVKKEEEEKRVLEVLTEVPKNAEEIGKLVQLGKSKTSEILARLRQAGRVNWAGLGKSKNPYLYTAKGEKSSAETETLGCGGNREMGSSCQEDTLWDTEEQTP